MRIQLPIALALFAAVIVPAVSSATLIVPSPRRFTGSGCVQASSTGAIGITTDDGSVFNNSSTDTLTVDCPVYGNLVEATDDSPLWYLDHSPSAITCTLLSEDASSTSVASQTLSSTGDDNNYRSLTFHITTLQSAYTHFRCTIPPRDSSGSASFIVGYGAD